MCYSSFRPSAFREVKLLRQVFYTVVAVQKKIMEISISRVILTTTDSLIENTPGSALTYV